MVSTEDSYQISCTFLHYLNAITADLPSQKKSTFDCTLLSTMALDYWLKNIQILIWRNKNKYFLCDTPATSQKDSSVAIITIIMFSGRVKHFDMWKKMKKNLHNTKRFLPFIPTSFYIITMWGTNSQCTTVIHIITEYF